MTSNPNTHPSFVHGSVAERILRVRGLVTIAITFVCLIIGIARADDSAVSFKKDVQPLLNRSCAGCHRQDKKKGKLDLTSYAAILHGGKGGPSVVAGNPEKSSLVGQVSGDEPEMPEKGEKLTAPEISILANWVRQGAHDDSGASLAHTSQADDGAKAPEEYRVAPVISALAVSPDGKVLAVTGWHEVLLHHTDGTGLIGRLPCRFPKITSMRFSPDSSRLVAAGGSAGEYGRIDIFDVPAAKRLESYDVSSDTLFGLSLSPSADRAAVGCADHSVRVIQLQDGKELDHFNVHGDWALATAFTMDGKRLVSGGRDKSMWLLDLPSHKAVDPVNDPNDPVTAVARDPQHDQAVYGSSTGALRLYRLTNLEKSTEQKREPNRIRDMEHVAGTVNAIEYSPDGKWFAVACFGETRIFTSDGAKRQCICQGNKGDVYGVAFTADSKSVYTGGFDGQIRIFNVEKGSLEKTFVPAPMKPEAAAAVIAANGEVKK